ncbi:MAG: tRNA (adenosine(37)-N6)-threonylcarbamoyltransferase complex ATPase subunit type 1 TsaE [Rikenellaceae bacterium]
MKTVEIESLSELEEVAQVIIEELRGRNIVLLRGEMGAGKTTLVSAIASTMGSEDSVNSPTFALVNKYITADKGAIYHFDMYRIEKIEEALDFGVEEYFDSGELCLIEWAEKIEELLPSDVVTVKIEVLSPTQRRFTIE